MSLFFGRLTQDFVTFELTRVKAELGDPASINALSTAASHFRDSAATDATYFAYLGISLALINPLTKP